MRRVPREGAAPAEQPERRASARAGMPQRSSPPAFPGACGAVHSCNCTRRKKRKGMRRERRSAKQPSDVRACVGLRERLADSPIAARLDLVPATLPLRRLIDCLRVSVGKLEATRSDAFLGWFHLLAPRKRPAAHLAVFRWEVLLLDAARHGARPPTSV